jgi:hypothetical protein
MSRTLTPSNFTQHRVVKFETNYNNKLSCECMVHIDRAPASPLPERVVTGTSISIETKDGSFGPTEWVLVDLLRLPLCQVSTFMSWQSHGLDYFEFAQLILNKFCSSDTYFPVAIYFYRRLRFDN